MNVAQLRQHLATFDEDREVYVFVRQHGEDTTICTINDVFEITEIDDGAIVLGAERA